jgi:hypothetical protein
MRLDYRSFQHQQRVALICASLLENLLVSSNAYEILRTLP